MPTPTGRHVNFAPVTWLDAASGSTLMTLKGVTNVDVDHRGSVIAHSGDADVFPTTKALVAQDPMVTVAFRDLKGLHQMPPGDRGTLTATHLDAKNLATAGGGGYTLAMANGIVEGNNSGGAHAQWGEGRVMVSGESVDGVTNPLTYTNL